nr:DUF190 domain-containing protein [Mycobacterium lepraemurium]
MDDDCLKLTTYLAERRRAGNRFVSDVLLDLYARHRVECTVLLRGIGGFGTGHRLRSDESLTLSEDPPVAIVATDTRAKIEALLDGVLSVKQRGLVTLERARLLHADVGAARPPEGDAVKLTVYLGLKQRVNGAPAYIGVCDLLHRRGLAGATVLLGVDGVAHEERRRASFSGRNVDVPMMIVVVGSGAHIGRVLPEIAALLRRPLFTLERVRVCTRDGRLLEPPHALPGVDERGLPLFQQLTVYTSESARHGGVPIHRAIVQRLRQATAADGATVLRGVWGFHGDHPPHGDGLFALTRRVPVGTAVVATPAHIDELAGAEGLVTSEMAPALVSDDGGPGAGRMARHRY